MRCRAWHGAAVERWRPSLPASSTATLRRQRLTSARLLLSWSLVTPCSVLHTWPLSAIAIPVLQLYADSLAALCLAVCGAPTANCARTRYDCQSTDCL